MTCWMRRRISAQGTSVWQQMIQTCWASFELDLLHQQSDNAPVTAVRAKAVKNNCFGLKKSWLEQFFCFLQRYTKNPLLTTYLCLHELEPVRFVCSWIRIVANDWGAPELYPWSVIANLMVPCWKIEASFKFSRLPTPNVFHQDQEWNFVRRWFFWVLWYYIEKKWYDLRRNTDPLSPGAQVFASQSKTQPWVQSVLRIVHIALDAMVCQCGRHRRINEHGHTWQWSDLNKNSHTCSGAHAYIRQHRSQHVMNLVIWEMDQILCTPDNAPHAWKFSKCAHQMRWTYLDDLHQLVHATFPGEKWTSS